ncbi:YheC/YheD family endospore coat-associated protein [Paenibacillus soyae]|uniref:YheC/YheD family protein n=1 Tax=Paenibacillus soyae TaxID=2969249 RepID=A0A9X2S706_9BACL|nr:YheC/YheD family protein [Paenibacillus soyae]MCR2802550.1 YheC/YheD family protein [Paenibacillus soyae]
MKLPASAVFGIFASPPSRGNEQAFPSEPRLCRELLSASIAMGMQAYVFTAADYNPRTQTLFGSRYADGAWERQPVPLPDVVYDRSFCRSAEERRSAAITLARMGEQRRFQFLNGKLPGKLTIYQALLEDDALAPYLPRTTPYTADALRNRLPERKSGLVLKPAAGMQGRGLVHISLAALSGELLARGRTGSNRRFSRSFAEITELSGWLKPFMRGSAFLIQPYLVLRDIENRPFDIRVLLQKDGSGAWKLTGMAARRGESGSLTSNLHGGGAAISAGRLLETNFGKPEAERLYRKIHTICGHTAKRLEDSFGRFGELAFDFGIEPSGKLWLLEANSKPGRDAFRQIGDDSAMKLSIERPLRYASYLTNRAAPTFVSAESAYDLVQPQRSIAIAARLRSSNVQEVHR